MRHIAGGKRLPAEVVQQISVKTDGVPLFVEELTKTIVESGLLKETAERYEFTGPLPALAIPTTLQDALMARLDRLGPAKGLAQLGATLGRQFAYALLREVAQRDEATVQRELGRLVEAELLYQRGQPPQATYRFKHALIQDAAYQSLLKSTRQQYHHRIAQVLEAQFPETCELHPELVAHHALGGEIWEKAVAYFQQAGTRAHARAAFREAVASFDQALQALAHLPESGETRMLALKLRLALTPPLNQLAEHGRRLALLGEAEALARALDDRARLAQVLARLGQVRMVTGDLDGALVAGQQALALAAELDESALQVEVARNLAQVYYAISDFRRSAALFRRGVEIADREAGTSMPDFRIRDRALLARTLTALGAFAEGRRHGEEALRLATLEGRGFTPMMVRAYLGLLYLAQGDLEQALPVLEQGLTLCRASDLQNITPVIVAGLGLAYALQGRLAEGRTCLEEAIREDSRMGVRHMPDAGVWLSEVCRLAGRGEEAWEHARQALDLARQHRERANEALALHQLGTVHAHANPPDVEQAEAHYQQALALATELGMRPLQAHCHRGLGKLMPGADDAPRPTRHSLLPLVSTVIWR